MTGKRCSVITRIDEREGGARVAHVTINNAGKLNALNSALMADFVTAFEELSRDQALRCVVLTGAGDRAFIGGADIDEMATVDATTARRFITWVHRCCHAPRELQVPVIARIHGFALGAGLEVAAACDLRVAAETSLFGMPEVKLGIPSVVEAALLPMLVGWGRAREILLLGETFSAAEAAAWGLVERVVAAADLDAAVERMVGSILAAGPCAVRQQKKLIRAWEDLPLRAAVSAGIDAFAASFATDEPRREMTRFLAARAARRNRDKAP
jgi:enoyl-CoA hydratase/carnithine racemase